MFMCAKEQFPVASNRTAPSSWAPAYATHASARRARIEWSDDATATLGPQVRAIVGDRDDDVHDTDQRLAD